MTAKDKIIEETKKFIEKYPDVEIPSGYFCIGRGNSSLRCKGYVHSFCIVDKEWRYEYSPCLSPKHYYFALVGSKVFYEWADSNNYGFTKGFRHDMHSAECEIAEAVREIQVKKKFSNLNEAVEIAGKINDVLRENKDLVLSLSAVKIGLFKNPTCRIFFNGMEGKIPCFNSAVVSEAQRNEFCLTILESGGEYRELPLSYEDCQRIIEAADDMVATSFKINGYSGKLDLRNGIWVFGCAKISCDTISKLINIYDDDKLRKRKTLEKVTLGFGTFSIAQLREMYDAQFKPKKFK